MLTKEEFVKDVQEKTKWIFSPNQIRKKMFGSLYHFKDNQYEIDRAMDKI